MASTGRRSPSCPACSSTGCLTVDAMAASTSHAAVVAQVLQHVSEFVQRDNHLWTRRCKRIRVVPLTNQTVGLLSGLDDAEPTKAGPLAPNPLVNVEKLLIAPGLHAKAHGIAVIEPSCRRLSG